MTSSRTQVTLDPEMQRRARHRAAQMGLSFAEYCRRLVARDLEERGSPVDVRAVFDLGKSSGSDVAHNKKAMLGEAVTARRVRARKR